VAPGFERLGTLYINKQENKLRIDSLPLFYEIA
jgi:hypothetical protein